MALFQRFHTVQELGGLCYDSRQCKLTNPHSMCNNKNRCECQHGNIKLNNSCLQGKIQCNEKIKKKSINNSTMMIYQILQIVKSLSILSSPESFSFYFV